MERSHLPFIGISLYALSLMVKEDRKYHVSFYWKYLTLISTLGIILYVGTLINSSLRAYSELKQVYIPSVSLNENLKIMESSVVKISSIDEAKSALRNASQRQGKEINLEDSDNFFIPKTYKNVKTGWLAFPLVLQNKLALRRRDMQIYLEKLGIQTRTIFTGNIMRQPVAEKFEWDSFGTFEVSDEIMRSGILLGSHNRQPKENLEFLVLKIKEAEKELLK